MGHISSRPHFFMMTGLIFLYSDYLGIVHQHKDAPCATEPHASLHRFLEYLPQFRLERLQRIPKHLQYQ